MGILRNEPIQNPRSGVRDLGANHGAALTVPSNKEKNRNMKACKFVLVALLLTAAAASAQEIGTPQYEVGVDYSGVHINSANYARHGTGNGGSGYFAYNINNMISLVGDFGGYANTRTGIDEKAMTYLFGPRFTWRHGRLNPYVQFLFGGAYAWDNPTHLTANSFATAAGGGLDYTLTHHIALKPIQVEYLMTQFRSTELGGATAGFGDHQNDIRYSAGVVFLFGDK